MCSAAIFDLDRTLIAGSSAEVFGQKLRSMGVAVPTAPGQSLFFRLYERFGEDPVTMRLARHASQLFASERVSTVQAAGRLAADVLASRVVPGAMRAIAKHRHAGDRLLIATTAPAELVEPLAEALDFDEAICTHYRHIDGRYDGTNDGPYLWADSKAEAVAAWAGDNAVDLTTSWAYSDSCYDIALFELVGNPVAVNADMRLALAARTRSWRREDWLEAPMSDEIPAEP